MKYNKLGRMNLRISALSIGGHMDWGKTMGRDEVEPLMVAAYEGGVNFFDSAERYGDGACETIIGEIIQRQTWPRESLVLGTKVSPRGTEAAKGSQIGLSRKRLIDALEVTLKRYRTDYLDLYILHRPDPESDPEEIVRTMNDLIRQGKICYWGTSHFPPETLTEYYRIADQLGLEGPHVEQSIHSMLVNHRARQALAPFIKKRGMGITAVMSLQMGMLTDKYTDGIPHESRVAQDPNLHRQYKMWEAKIAKVRKVAADLGISTATLALAWCLKDPDISTTVAGASKLAHVEANLQALDAVPLLSEDVLQRIERITKDA